MWITGIGDMTADTATEMVDGAVDVWAINMTSVSITNAAANMSVIMNMLNVWECECTALALSFLTARPAQGYLDCSARMANGATTASTHTSAKQCLGCMSSSA